MKNPAGSWLRRADQRPSTGIETTHAHGRSRA
jgi:hypothetical protein